MIMDHTNASRTKRSLAEHAAQVDHAKLAERARVEDIRSEPYEMDEIVLHSRVRPGRLPDSLPHL